MRYLQYVLCAVAFAVTSFCTAQSAADISGAWRTETTEGTIVMICSDGFFTAAVYDLEKKTFSGTCGGRYQIQGKQFVEVHEFNTMKPEWIGKELKSPVEIKNDKLLFTENASAQEWTRIDNNKPNDLAGAWLITGRMSGGLLNKITPGARRTLKILSGTRFQWVAYNVETKEFFGTGGGTYTTRDGKYTEVIDFFSRDNSRVGKSLSFDFALDNDGNWRHKGFSSKGDPIDEIWTKRQHVKL
jgi:hypothetical protein